MTKLLKSYIPIIAIFIFVIFYISKIFYDKTLHFGEEKALIDYTFANWRYSKLWIGSLNFGNVAPAFFIILTLGKIWSLANLLHLDIVSSQRLFYFICIFFTSLFFYLLTRTLTKNTFFSLLLSFIYITTYNYYSSLDTSGRVLHYLILPAALFFWTKYNITQKSRYLLCNIILIVSTLSIANNPPQMIGAYSFIFLYVIILFGKREYLSQIILFLTPYIGTIVFVLGVDLLALMNNANYNNYDLLSILWSAPSSPLNDILRFFGSWGDYSGSGLIEYYNHLLTYYHSNIGLVLTYIPIAIFLLLLYRVNRTKKNLATLITIVIIINIILAKGSGSPFGGIYDSFQDFQLFQIFREPWAKFIINVIFSIYIGIALLFQGQKKLIQILSVFILFVYFGFQSYPLISGTALDHRYIDWKVSDVQIPDYWLEAQKYSEQAMKEGRTLVLPTSKNRGEALTHSWEPYQFRGFPEQLFITGNIVTNTGNDGKEIDIMNAFYKHLDPYFISRYSIDYILVKNDAITDPNTTIGLQSIIKTIDTGSKKKFGKVDIYEVKEQYKTDKIRILSEFRLQNNTCDFIHEETNISKAFAFVDKKNIPSTLNFQNISLEVTKNNETSYKLVFQDRLTEPIALLFADAYNDGWKLYDSNDMFAKPLEKVLHFPANCFLNAWVIPSNIKLIDQTLYLKYEPQIFFDFILYGFTGLLIIYCLLIFFSSKLSLTSFLNYLKINTKKTVLHSLCAFCVNIPNLLMSQHKKLRRFIPLQFFPLNMLLPLWILVLSTFSILIISNIFTKSSLGGTIVFGYSTVLFISFISLRLQSKFFILGAFIILILCPLFRIANNKAVAESLAVWVVMFLILYVMSAILESIFPRYQNHKEVNYDIVKRNFKALLRDAQIFIQFLEQYMRLKIKGQIQKKYYIFLRNHYLFFRYIITERKDKDFIQNLHRIAVKLNISVMRIMVYLLIILIILGLITYIQYKENQEMHKLAKTFIITSVNPPQAAQATKVILQGYKFGIKSDDAYKINSDQGYITEIKKWDQDIIEFIVPLSTDPGKLKIWIERPVDELHRDQGIVKSNPVVLGVFSRFQIYPEVDDTFKDRVIKKIKNFSFYNLR